MNSILSLATVFALVSDSAAEAAGSLVGALLSMILVFVPFILITGFVFLISVVMVVVMGFPLYRMAKNAGIPNPWLAFIPYGNTWIMVSLAKKPFDMFGGKIVMERKKAATMITLAMMLPLVLAFVSMILGMIPFIGFIFSMLISLCLYAYSIGLMVLRYFIYEDIFATYMPNDENKVLWVVLSLFVPIVFTVLMYIHMNDTADYTYEEYYRKVANRNAAPVSPAPVSPAPAPEVKVEAPVENKTESQAVNLEK